MMSIRFVQVLLEIAERAGVARARLLEAAEFEPERLEAAEGRVTPSEYYRLCARALDLTADPALGLHYGNEFDGSTFHLISYMVSCSASLRQGIETLCEFQELLGDQFRFRVIESEHTITLCSAGLGGAPPHVRRFMAEMELIGRYRLLRYFNPRARPRSVLFEHRAPAYRSEYARIFGTPARFQQPITAIVFDRAFMDTPSMYRDDDLYRSLRIHAQHSLQQHAHRGGVADQVRIYLMRECASGRHDMRTVAHALGLSERTLRRRIAAEGTSYSAIANDALASMAKYLLSVERRTIQETAYALGYADSGAFHRAFKRWTGMTPSAFRTLPRASPP